MLGRRRVRQAQGGRLHRIVIDDEVQGRERVPAGQAAEREVLDPDAGMKQLRLMTRDQEVFVENVRDRFAEGG